MTSLMPNTPYSEGPRLVERFQSYSREIMTYISVLNTGLQCFCGSRLELHSYSTACYNKKHSGYSAKHLRLCSTEESLNVWKKGHSFLETHF